MKAKPMPFGRASLFMALALALPAQAQTSQTDTNTVLIDGSSTVYPISREAARRFQRQQRDARIEVRFSGTTAGFRKFCAGEIDIADASRPIDETEAAACADAQIKYQRMPVATDAIVIVAHPQNRWASDITVAELRKLWSPEAEGKVMRWSDIRADWPEQPVKLFGRGQDSGTYDIFTSEITGTSRASRKDYNASENEEELAAAIAAEPNALAFFGIGAYHRHWDELKLLAVDAGEGPVYPSLETVRDGKYRPLSRPLYLYINSERLAAKPTMQAFIEHYQANIGKFLILRGLFRYIV